MEDKFVLKRRPPDILSARQAVIRVGEDTYEELRILAGRTNRSISSVADRAIRFALDRLELVTEVE